MKARAPKRMCNSPRIVTKIGRGLLLDIDDESVVEYKTVNMY